MVPYELQCPRQVSTDGSWEDPMRFECSLPRASQRTSKRVANTTDKKVGAPAKAASRFRLTYQRRPKVHDRRPLLVTPTRLDFGAEEEQAAAPNSQPATVEAAGSASWALTSVRRHTPRRSGSGGRPTTVGALRPDSPSRSSSSTPPASSTSPTSPAFAPTPTSLTLAQTPPPAQATERTPATAAAMAATTAFLAGISLATRSPLISAIPAPAALPVRQAPPAPKLRRSGRLAQETLNLTVRPSKKGEILAMKRLGFIGKGGCSIDDARREFERFFSKIVDIQNLPALRDLFPAARELSDEELLAAARQAGVVVQGC